MSQGTKTAPRALRASQEGLAAIVDAIDGLIYACSPDLDLKFVNRRLAERLGGDPAGERCYLALYGRDAPCPWCRNEQVFAGETVRWQFAHPADGRAYDVLETTVHHDGRPSKVALLRDVTDERRVATALRDSEERFRRIAETMTDYVFTVTVQDGVPVRTVHGPGCVTVTGYTPEDLAGDLDLWLRMVVPEDREAVLAHAHAILAGEPVGPVEHRIVRKDGQVRWVRDTPSPQVDDAGRLVAYDGLIQDITERRALEEQLLQAQKMESIGRLAGGVAHDFNNLLTAILGNAELARSSLPEESPARADLDEVVHAAERAAALTGQLLGFARRQVIAPVLLEPNAIVAESDEMLRRLLGEHIEITTVLALDAGSIEADPAQVQQLLVNLAVNARDAMPRGGQLFIETANEVVTAHDAELDPTVPAGNYVVLSVTDTGASLSDEARAHLFEPFYPASDQGRGTSLALATCYGIVTQNGGHLTVHAEDGRGTTLRILLPRRDVSTAAPPDAQVGAAASRGTETILVVEDDPAVRRLAVLVLRARGYRVIEADDGPRALAVVATPEQIDLLLTDVVMPGMSGPELVEQVASVRPGMRTLLMSGHVDERLMSIRLDASQAFLPKPFTPERLARKVRETLDAAP